MKPETERSLSEERNALRRVDSQFTDANSMTLDNARALYYIYENALNAPVIEKYGNIPRRYWTHNLETLSQSFGLLTMIPTSLQTALHEMTPYYLARYTTESAYMTLVNSSTPQQWSERIRGAGELLDFVEHKVIDSPPTFNQLVF